MILIVENLVQTTVQYIEIKNVTCSNKLIISLKY